jgi:DNA-binding beta-propeller fold protein YncE
MWRSFQNSAITLCGCLLIGLLGPVHAQVSHPTLLVVNQGDHNLSLVDPVTLKPIATVDVGGVTGHEVAVLPDGHTAVVPIYSNVGVGKAGTDGQKMAVIDLSTRKLMQQIDFGHGVRPHCVVLDGRRNLLYVTTELDQAITILDARTLKVVGRVPTTQAQSHMLALSPDGHRGYTANVGPGTVSVLDLDARKTIKVIPISGNTQRISVSRDGTMVFTSDQTAPRLAVIDTKTNSLRSFIPLPEIGYGSTTTPDDHSVLVALRTAHQVAQVDLATMKVVRTISVSGNPTEIVISPDSKFAWISGDTSVSRLNLATWHVDETAAVGNDSDGLALAP